LEDNIEVDLKEIGCGNVYWIQLAQDRNQWLVPVNTVIKLRLRKNLINYIELSCELTDRHNTLRCYPNISLFVSNVPF